MTGGFAGCSGGSGVTRAENRRTTDRDMDDEYTDGEHTDDERSDEDGPFDEAVELYERHEVGDPDLPKGVEPHELYVRNAADEAREISVRIDRDGEPVFERTETIPADAYLEVVLVEPAVYGAVVETDGTTSKTTIDRSWADCARSQTIVTLRAGGIKTQSRSIQSTCE